MRTIVKFALTNSTDEDLKLLRPGLITQTDGAQYSTVMKARSNAAVVSIQQHTTDIMQQLEMQYQTSSTTTVVVSNSVAEVLKDPVAKGNTCEL